MASQRLSSGAPNNDSTAHCYVLYSKMNANFRHVHRRRLERLVRLHFCLEFCSVIAYIQELIYLDYPEALF